MTNEELEIIRKRAESATAGPWYCSAEHVATKPGIVGGYPSSPESICETNDGEYIENPNGRKDAEFIAHAREDVPKLLAEIETLRGNIATIEKLTKCADTKDFAKRALIGEATTRI